MEILSDGTSLSILGSSKQLSVTTLILTMVTDMQRKRHLGLILELASVIFTRLLIFGHSWQAL